MSNTDHRNLTDLIREAKERGIYYSRSTIKCTNCKAIFPIEYDNCPQCELDELYRSLKIQYRKLIRGKVN